MKRILPLLLIVAFALALLAGCGQATEDAATSQTEPDGQAGGDKLQVVSALFPGYDFAREIGGEQIALSMLLPPGAESHSFEPTLQDILTLQSCDVFIYVGGESDTWVDGVLASMDTTNMTILAMMDLVEVVEEELKEGMEEESHDHDSGEDEDPEEETEYDEHVWTAPANAIRITRAITDTFCALDEDNADTYTAACAAYTAQLEELDAGFRQVVEAGARSTLIFGDRFPFRYFVDAYGLDYFAAFPGCSSETEASAKTVAFLIDKVSDEGVPVVFYIEFSNGKIADTICEGTGAKKLLFHSCHNVTKDEFESGVSYLSLMTQNMESLKEALA